MLQKTHRGFNGYRMYRMIAALLRSTGSIIVVVVRCEKIPADTPNHRAFLTTVRTVLYGRAYVAFLFG